MCLTIPAKITEINNEIATVIDYNGKTKQIIISGIKEPQLNDWVLINANIAINKISEKEAKEIIKLLKNE